MSETNASHFDLNQQLDKALEPYFAKYHRDKCYVGLLFQQGKRKMLQINVPAHDLPILLQAKPSSGNDPDSGKNRPEVQGHAEEIKEYINKRIEKNKPWILGTLTANVDPDKIELFEFSRGICFVVVRRGVKLDITDGQHRKRAIHELIESSKGELIGDNDFPITLVLEKDLNQCQADFRDMAQTRQLDKSLLLSFGEFEGRVGITKNLIEQVSMFNGKTEKIKNSPSTKHKLIYTTNYIARSVSCTFEDDPSHELKDYDVKQYSEALVGCLNQFFSECRQTRYICEISVKDLTVQQVGNFKEDCLLGRSIGLEILGRLLYCIYNKNGHSFAHEKVSQMAQIDWSRECHLWKGNVVLFNSKSYNSNKTYQISTNASAVKIAVSQAKAELGWT
jgi:DNA sulfur modification protein DndB